MSINRNQCSTDCATAPGRGKEVLLVCVGMETGMERYEVCLWVHLCFHVYACASVSAHVSVCVLVDIHMYSWMSPCVWASRVHESLYVHIC